MSETQPILLTPGQAPPRRRSFAVGQLAAASFTVALAVGALLRFWGLSGAPDWQYDEGIYTQVATNVLHGTLAEHITYGLSWQPFLYQPPLYFLLLARWFELTGASIFHARILGVLCSLGTLTVLFRLMWRLRGPAAALFISLPVIFDGWLLYIQRASYIENFLLLLITVSVLLYQRALEVPTVARFAAAGGMIAVTIAVKYTAAYLVAVVLLCWLITSARGEAAGVADLSARASARGEASGIADTGEDSSARGEAGFSDVSLMANARGEATIADYATESSARGEARVADPQGFPSARGEARMSPTFKVINARGEATESPTAGARGHLALLGTTAAVLAVYAAVMYWWFDLPQGQDWWVRQNAVQIRRVLGLQKSGGTLTSPGAALHLLFAQYRVFAPSFVVAVAAFTLGAVMLVRCWRARSWGQLQRDALLWSWMSAGVVVFGSSSLRFPQYFALILVPMYCYIWSAVWAADRSARLKLAAVAVAVVLGVGSFWLRVPAQTGNPFREVQAYAASSIPPGAVVVTEEAIGDLIRQRWCRVEQPANCARAATYAITWKTYLQSSFTLGGAPFAKMMQGAVPLRSWPGFSGTATVWRLK